MADANANKDEAVRCVQIGLRFVNAGDLERAVKYIDKAERSKFDWEGIARGLAAPSATGVFRNRLVVFGSGRRPAVIR